METMNTKSILTLLPSANYEIATFCSDLIQRVKSGETSAIEMQTRLEYLNKVYKNIAKEIRKNLENELEGSEDKIEVLGMEITKTTTKRNNYSNDAEYNRLKKALKDREEFLKGLKKPMADPETGEIVEPPTVKESIKITFKAK